MKRRILAVSALALAVSASSRGVDCSSTTFVTAVDYPAVDSAQIVRTGDFTSDGKTDLIVISQYEGLAVLPGAGDGTFGAPIPATESDYYASGAAVGLFDSGTNLDVAVAYSDGIRVFPGNGDGSFQPSIFTQTPYQPSGLVAADFDGDGKLDLAVSSGSDVHVYLGAGNGSFTEHQVLSNGATVIALATGQLRAFNRRDLVATMNDGTVLFWLNLGTGFFDAPQALVLGGSLGGVVVADLNNDALNDIAVSVDSYVAVFYNIGNDGTFSAATEYPTGSSPLRLTVGDFDGDGLQDVAVLQGPYYQVAGVIGILLQQPGGSLGSVFAFNAGSSPQDLTAADFNGDGSFDLALASYSSDSATVLLADGGGSFEAIRVAALGSTPVDLAAGDFLGNGLTQFVELTNDNGSQITLLDLDDHGRFVRGASTSMGGVNATNIAAGDFDGDGNLDIVANDFYASAVAILFGHGDGTFDPPTYWVPVGQQPTTLVPGDFDGDGRLDLAVQTAGDSFGDVAILLNAGSGVLSYAGALVLTHSPSHITTALLNGDGFADVIVAGGGCCGQASVVSIFLSNGDGTFLPPADYAAGGIPAWVEAADFDGDGSLDLVTANSNASNISILKGDGAGGFGSPKLIAVGSPSSSIVIAPFEGFGYPDILVVEPGANRVALLLGLGDGSFRVPEFYSVGINPSRGFGGRFFGGRPEAAIQNSDGTLSFLQNTHLLPVVAGKSVIVGSTAVLHALADGFGSLTYQWRRNGVLVSDGGRISGATTATLTIDPVAFDDIGAYRAVVTDSCTTVESNDAFLSVEFDDVPIDNPFHNDIITIAMAGITGGCTPTSYCPSNPVSRAEMAVFLLKAKYGADHVPPPPPPDPIFPDVPADAFAAAWIDELATLGVTSGCGGGLYCPDRSVSRAEMAVFLLKTLLGSGYVPPPPTGIFADVPPDNFAIAWIEDLYNRAITTGCAFNPLRYCPDSIVPREQMATFLVRTFGL